MDIDLPRDYVFREPSDDSDRESHHSFVPIPPTARAAAKIQSSNKEAIFTDSDPSKDGFDGED